MTRLRNKPVTDHTDGGAFNGSNRPPLELLSKRFQELFAEFDALNSQRSAASSELASLIVNWGTHAETARKADGLATANVARNGGTTVSTAHKTELEDKRTALQDTIDSLTEAEKLIMADLAEERTREQEHLDKYRQAETANRAQLVKDLAKVTESATKLAQSIAIREWVESHSPWDPSVAVNVLEIWGPAASLNGPTHHPVQINAVTAALASL